MNKYFLFLMLSITLSSFAQMLLKKATLFEYENKIREYLNIYVILGYGMMFASLLLSVSAMKGMDYKAVSALESLGYILVLFLSYIFFKEKLTKNKILGVIIIVIGTYIFFI